MLDSFLKSGNYEVDESCIDNLVPIDFAGVLPETVAVSMMYFNTPYLWGQHSATSSDFNHINIQ